MNAAPAWDGSVSGVRSEGFTLRLFAAVFSTRLHDFLSQRPEKESDFETTLS
jgi:hypothetical protein